MFDKNNLIPPGYTIVGGSMEEGFLTLQSPMGSQYTVSFKGDNPISINKPTSPFETDFTSFL